MDTIVYIAAIAAIIFSIWAQIKVNSTFKRFSRVATASGRSAASVAQSILNSNGVYDVRIERVSGSLTDHYDPTAKVLRLSDSVFGSSSAAAVGVAAHEAGHAVQYAHGYFPVKIRSALVPAASFSSKLSWIVLMAGIVCMMLLDTTIGFYVAIAGIGLFAVAALFELVTLPCEFDASKRAINALRQMGSFTDREIRDSQKVLSAAALTYVAALAVSVTQIFRLLLYVLRVSGRRR